MQHNIIQSKYRKRKGKTSHDNTIQYNTRQAKAREDKTIQYSYNGFKYNCNTITLQYNTINNNTITIQYNTITKQ